MVKRSVSFDRITVHEFLPVIGDSPTCSCGVPIALGDELLVSHHFSVSKFELIRSFSRRSSRQELVLPNKERRKLLLARGYSQSELDDAEMRTSQARKEIFEGSSNAFADKFTKHQERFEKAAARLFTTFVRMRRSSNSAVRMSNKLEEGARCA
jgi:hypothetical protein